MSNETDGADTQLDKMRITLKHKLKELKVRYLGDESAIGPSSKHRKKLEKHIEKFRRLFQNTEDKQLSSKE